MMTLPSKETAAGYDPERSLVMRPVAQKTVVSRLEFWPIGETKVVGDTQAAVLKLSGAEDSVDREIDLLKALLHDHEEQMELRLAEARANAKCMADSEWKERIEEKVSQERFKMNDIVDGFREERTKYFAAVEREVVKLSLAIAAQVLHREIKLDAVLLSGAVRVALDQVVDKTATVLHVPSADLALWEATMRGVGAAKLEIVGDDSLAAGECFLDTRVGIVELGIKVQLEEIERGFFDLLQQRPV